MLTSLLNGANLDDALQTDVTSGVNPTEADNDWPLFGITECTWSSSTINMRLSETKADVLVITYYDTLYNKSL